MMKSERIALLEKRLGEANARELAMLALIRTLIVTLGQGHPEGVKAGVASFVRGATNGLYDLSKANFPPEAQEAMRKQAASLIIDWLQFDPLSSNTAPMQ